MSQCIVQIGHPQRDVLEHIHTIISHWCVNANASCLDDVSLSHIQRTIRLLGWTISAEELQTLYADWIVRGKISLVGSVWNITNVRLHLQRSGSYDLVRNITPLLRMLRDQDARITIFIRPYERV